LSARSVDLSEIYPKMDYHRGIPKKDENGHENGKQRDEGCTVFRCSMKSMMCQIGKISMKPMTEPYAIRVQFAAPVVV